MHQLAALRQNKKTSNLERFFICNNGMVQHLQKSLHEIQQELLRWRAILEVPYQQFLLNR